MIPGERFGRQLRCGGDGPAGGATASAALRRGRVTGRLAGGSRDAAECGRGGARGAGLRWERGVAVASGLSGDLGRGERSGVASWAEVRVLGRHRGRERGEGSGPGFGLGRDLGLSWVLGSFSISFSFSFANSHKLV